MTTTNNSNEYRYVWFEIQRTRLPLDIKKLIEENNFICQIDNNNPGLVSELAIEFDKFTTEDSYLFRIKMNFGSTGEDNAHFVVNGLGWKYLCYRIKLEPIKFNKADQIDLVQHKLSEIIDDFGCFPGDCKDYRLITYYDGANLCFSLRHEPKYHTLLS